MSFTVMVAAAALSQPLLEEGTFWQNQANCVGQLGDQQCSCPSGMSIVGVQRTMNNVDGIDAFECAKAAGSIGTMGCELLPLPNSFPWPKCPGGKVMTGVHTSCGQYLDCIDALICCNFQFPGGMAGVATEVADTNWWSCLDSNQQCSSANDVFLSGFYRHSSNCGWLHCLETAHSVQIHLVPAASVPLVEEGTFWQDQANCVGQLGNQQCSCPSGMSIVGVQRTMNNVDGIDAFECAKAEKSIGTKNCEVVPLPDTYPWPKCPAGKVVTGVHTSCGQYLDCIDALICCDYDFPAGLAVVATDVADTNWWGCLDYNQKCSSAYNVFLSGFYRHSNNCGFLHCLETAHSLQFTVTCQGVELSTTGTVSGELINGATHTGSSGLELTNIPAYLNGAEAFFPPVSVADGTVIDLHCCGEECTFYVAVYHCSPCSSDRGGKLIGNLLTKGWTGSSCAPNFVIDSRGYPMTILHKTTSGSFSLTTEGSTDFIAIFKTSGGVTAPLCAKNQGPSVPSGCNTQCAPNQAR